VCGNGQGETDADLRSVLPDVSAGQAMEHGLSTLHLLASRDRFFPNRLPSEGYENTERAYKLEPKSRLDDTVSLEKAPTRRLAVLGTALESQTLRAARCGRCAEGLAPSFWQTSAPRAYEARPILPVADAAALTTTLRGSRRGSQMATRTLNRPG